MTENGSNSEEPTAQLPAETPPQAPIFKDRRPGLIAFGVVQLLLALVALVMAGVQAFMFFNADRFAPGTETSPGLFAFGAGFYVLLGVGAAWLGIGSIKCRRWARALTLVLSWIGLVTGVLTSVLMALMFRSMSEILEQSAGPNAPGMALVMGCTFIGVGFLYIVLPAAFLLFYRGRNVKATCEHYDPQARWTDRRPLPVLGGSLLLLSMGGAVFAPVLGTGVPFFGMLLTGAASVVMGVVLGVASLVLAWGFFRLERWAWFGALVVVTASGLSAFFTFRGDGLLKVYEQMQVPPEQLELIKSGGLLSAVSPLMLASLVVMLGFYLWTGRYFGPKAA